MSNSATLGADKQDWSQAAASKVKDAAASVGESAGCAASAVGAMVGRAATCIGNDADVLTADAGACIEGMGERLSKNMPHAGMVGTASQAVAGVVKESGEYLKTAKLGGMTEDIAHLIRRNPIPTVLLAIGVGWYVSSKMRS